MGLFPEWPGSAPAGISRRRGCRPRLAALRGAQLHHRGEGVSRRACAGGHFGPRGLSRHLAGRRGWAIWLSLCGSQIAHPGGVAERPPLGDVVRAAAPRGERGGRARATPFPR